MLRGRQRKGSNLSNPGKKIVLPLHSRAHGTDEGLPECLYSIIVRPVAVGARLNRYGPPDTVTAPEATAAGHLRELRNQSPPAPQCTRAFFAHIQVLSLSCDDHAIIFLGNKALYVPEEAQCCCRHATRRAWGSTATQNCVTHSGSFRPTRWEYWVKSILMDVVCDLGASGKGADTSEVVGKAGVALLRGCLDDPRVVPAERQSRRPPTPRSTHHTFRLFRIDYSSSLDTGAISLTRCL